MLSTCTELDKSARGNDGLCLCWLGIGKIIWGDFGSRVYESSGIVPVASVVIAVLLLALAVVYQAFKGQTVTEESAE